MCDVKFYQGDKLKLINQFPSNNHISHHVIRHKDYFLVLLSL